MSPNIEPEALNVELANLLRTLLSQQFRGHTLAERLQFSPDGRDLLRRADAAIEAATAQTEQAIFTTG